MEHEVTVEYNREIIDYTIKQLWKKWCLRDTFVALILLLLSLLAIFVFKWNDWVFKSLLILCIISFIVFAGIYLVYRNRSLRNFEKMESPIAVWRFSDEYISTESDIGKSELKWKMIKKIYEFQNVLVLQYINQSISILPITNLSQETKNFIVDKVKKQNRNCT